MRAISILCLFAITLPAPASELDGHYRGSLDDRPSELILHSQGAEVTGEYVEGPQLRFKLSGRFDGQMLQAQISDPRSGQVLANMNANYANDMLNASLAARDPGNGETLVREALFQRVAPPPPPPDPHQDPALVGTWVNELSSESAELATLTTITTLRLRADGSVAQWRRVVSGGNDWSYDRPGELQYSGRWRSENGLLLVQLEGAREFQPAARYRFSAPFLVTESNTGEMTWQHR